MNEFQALRELFLGFAVKSEPLHLDSSQPDWPYGGIVEDIHIGFQHHHYLHATVSAEAMSTAVYDNVNLNIVRSTMRQWAASMYEAPEGDVSSVPQPFAWWLFDRTGGRKYDRRSNAFTLPRYSIAMVNQYVIHNLVTAPRDSKISSHDRDCYPVGGPLFPWEDIRLFRESIVPSLWLPVEVVLVTPVDNLVLVVNVDERSERIDDIRRHDYGLTYVDMDFSWGFGAIDPEVVELAKISDGGDVTKGQDAVDWIHRRLKAAAKKAFEE